MWSSIAHRFVPEIKSKLTNLMKITRIEGYNDKYGSNPQGIREISDDLFEFVDHPNHDLNHSVDAKMSLKVIRIKRFKICGV